MSPILELQNLSFFANDKTIIHDISLTVNPGDFIVMLGGNGSGKSSLLKLINQTYHPTAGQILFQQKAIKDYDPKTLQQQIVTLTQFIADSIFTDLTIEENAVLIESAYANQSIDKKSLIKQLPDYLSQFNQKLPSALKTQVKALSGGEQQVLAFALYLRHQPNLLLLDEHTSALDPKKADQVMEQTYQYLHKNHITCLMTTHSLPYAIKYGNKLIALQNGTISFAASDDEKARLNTADLLTHCY